MDYAKQLENVNIFDTLLGIESDTNIKIKWFPTRNKVIETYGDICLYTGLLLQYETEKQVMKFTWFPDTENFTELLIIYSTMERCFHEIISPERPHKIYFDLDWKKNTYSKSQVSHWLSLLEEKLPCLFLEYYNLPIRDIMIYEGETDEKYSFHLILPEYFSSHYMETKKFAEFVSKSLQIPLDFAVYKPWQTLRLPYNIKRSTHIPLLPHNQDTLNLPYHSAILSFSPFCRLLEPKSFYNPIHHVPTESSSDSLDITIQTFLENNKLIFVRKVGAITVLQNKGGFYCPRCKEIHHKVHPFILETPSAISFSCRQASMTILKQKSTIMAEF